MKATKQHRRARQTGALASVLPSLFHLSLSLSLSLSPSPSDPTILRRCLSTASAPAAAPAPELHSPLSLSLSLSTLASPALFDTLLCLLAELASLVINSCHLAERSTATDRSVRWRRRAVIPPLSRRYSTSSTTPQCSECMLARSDYSLLHSSFNLLQCFFRARSEVAQHPPRLEGLDLRI